MSSIRIPDDARGGARLELPEAPPDYFIYLVSQLFNQRQRQVELELRALDLSVTAWQALSVIAKAGRCSMSRLSRISGIDRTTMTRAVDRLITDGLVQRETTPNDRRMVLLILTPKGGDIHQQACAINERINKAIVGHFSQAEQVSLCQNVCDILSRLISDRSLLTELLDPGRQSVSP